MSTNPFPFSPAAKNWRTLLAPFLAAFLASSSLRAVDYVYSDTIDLGTVVNQTAWNWSLNAPAFSFTSGDTFSGTINFANGQRLQFSNMGGGTFDIWARLFSPVFVTGDLNKTTALDDLQGTLIGQNPQTSNGGGIAIAMIFAEVTGQSPNTLSISGFQYSATMNSITGAFNSDAGGFFSAAVLSGPGTISVVPEPSTYALLALAGAAALLISRRRKQTAEKPHSLKTTEAFAQNRCLIVNYGAQADY